MHDYIRHLRSMIGNTKVVIPGVRAIICDEQGRLLLEKQALFESWALPHGCVDLGESALDAVIRETREETGIEIVRAELLGIYTDPSYSVTYPNGDEVQTFTIAFLARQWEGTPEPDQDEVVELGFFPTDALPDAIYPVHRDTIEDFLAFDGTPVVK